MAEPPKERPPQRATVALHPMLMFTDPRTEEQETRTRYREACLQEAADIKVMETDGKETPREREKIMGRIIFLPHACQLIAADGLVPAWLTNKMAAYPYLAIHVVAGNREYVDGMLPYITVNPEVSAILLAWIDAEPERKISRSVLDTLLSSVAWSPVHAGKIMAKLREETRRELADRVGKKIRENADTDARAAIGMCLLHPGIAPSLDPEQFEEDIESIYLALTMFGTELPPDTKARLLELAEEPTARWAYALLRDIPEAQNIGTIRSALLRSPAWTIEYVVATGKLRDHQALSAWVIPALKTCTFPWENDYIHQLLEMVRQKDEDENEAEDIGR